VAEFKKKQATAASIADAVAAEQGITKGLAKAIVQSTFRELIKQFKETGYVRIQDFGVFEVSISIRSGQARSFFVFRPGAKWKKWLKELPSNPKNEEFLEYILARDGEKYEKFESIRLRKLELIKQYRDNDRRRDQERIAKFVQDKFGIEVEQESIETEYLTPFRDRKVRLPERRTSVREMLTIAGGLPPQKSNSPLHPENTSQSAEPPNSNSPS
jgi:nucleoid DNA-binding protein